MESIEAEKPKSSAWMIWFAGGMLIGLLVLIGLAGRFRSSGVGRPLPDLDLQPLVGNAEPVTRESLKGKVVVIHVWGAWCPDCLREYAEFRKLQDAFKDSPEVKVLSVSCSAGAETDLEDLRKQTVAFYEKFGGEVPTYSDSTAYTREQIAYVVPSGRIHYPTTLIAGRDGKVAFIWEERLPNVEQLKSIIAKLP